MFGCRKQTEQEVEQGPSVPESRSIGLSTASSEEHRSRVNELLNDVKAEIVIAFSTSVSARIPKSRRVQIRVMVTRQRLRFALTVVLWTTISTTLLAAFGAFSLELLVVVAYIGLLLAAEMTAPTVVRPEWRTNVRGLLLAGGAVVALIAGRRLLQILSQLVG